MKEQLEKLNKIESELLKYQEVLTHLEYLDENTKTFEHNINELKSELDDQLKRLNKKTFEIAIVGPEKAGKSSLLNAWLGFNLCPTEEKRCTYTTTEIRSCSSLKEQKYEIEYFTRVEYENSNFKKSLTEKEIKEIEIYSEEIDKYLNKDLLSVNFEQFESVQAALNSAICHPGHALAVKKICIWTPKLNVEENVVFYDVPGYDSAITLHKDQTKAKVAAADAVLYVKRFTKPTLNECEQDILQICDSSNKYIKAKDKLIVALTGCDQAGSTQKYNKLINDNLKIWNENGIESWRIVPVCALAELESNSAEVVRARYLLKENNGGDTGFQRIKDATKRCVSDAKLGLASDRCASMPNKLKDISTKIFGRIKDVYNIDENTKLKKSLKSDEMDKIYKQWWSEKWKEIEEDFHSFYQNSIRPKVDPDAPNFLSKEDLDFKQLYDNTVINTFNKIEATKKERQEKIYKKCAGDDGVTDPNLGNTTIRAELAQDFINNLDNITNELNKFLWIKIDKMIEWIRKNLWQIPEIKEELIGKDVNIETLLFKKSFEVLIQSLARPAINIFIKNSRTKIVRIRMMEEYQMELLTLNKFIINGQVCERGIIQFLANGQLGDFDINVKKTNILIDIPVDKLDSINEEEDKLFAEELFDELKLKPVSRKTWSKKGIKKDPSIVYRDKKDVQDLNDSKSLNEVVKIDINQYKRVQVSESQFNQLKFSENPQHLSEVQLEIEQDINEFLNCMKNSIFYGSRIQRFYSSELDKFKRKFIELEKDKGRWRHYVELYMGKNDTRVIIPAPTMADELKEREQILNRIKEIINIYSSLGINNSKISDQDE